MIQRRTLIASAAALWAGSSFGQSFPSQAITLIAPSVPGGSTDVVCRALAAAVSRHLGVPVIVQNKAGAGGALGAMALATAKPDGYTVSLLPLAVFRVALMQKASFDPLRDVSYVIGLGGFVFGLAVPADGPFPTLNELLAHARQHPGELSYGHSGVGSTPHLAVEELGQKAGVKLTAVPYKGSAEALVALLGHQISMMSGTTEFMPHVKSKKLRVLATLGSQRSKAFPDAPTLRESGVDIVNESPFGIGAPRNTDPAIVKILHDAFKLALEDSAVQAAFDSFELPIKYMNSRDYSAFASRTVEAERATLARLDLLRKE